MFFLFLMNYIKLIQCFKHLHVCSIKFHNYITQTPNSCIFFQINLTLSFPSTWMNTLRLFHKISIAFHSSSLLRPFHNLFFGASETLLLANLLMTCNSPSWNSLESITWTNLFSIL